MVTIVLVRFLFSWKKKKKKYIYLVKDDYIFIILMFKIFIQKFDFENIL